MKASETENRPNRVDLGRDLGVQRQTGGTRELTGGGARFQFLRRGWTYF